MQVDAVLKKITGANPDITGCMAICQGRVFHNLEAPYDMFPVAEVLETFGNIYGLTESLSDEDLDFGDFVMGFDDHTFVVRPVEDGLLVALAKPMQRAQILKVQVALGLYANALLKAVEAGEVAETAVAAPVAPAAHDAVSQPVPKESEAAAEPPKKVRMYRGVAYYD